MKDQLERRLEELKAEFRAGQRMLAEVEAKEASLKESLLRISGAVQVLEEELSKLVESAEDGPKERVKETQNGQAGGELPKAGGLGSARPALGSSPHQDGEQVAA